MIFGLIKIGILHRIYNWVGGRGELEAVRYFVSIIVLVCVVSTYTILSDIGTLVGGVDPQGSFESRN